MRECGISPGVITRLLAWIQEWWVLQKCWWLRPVFRPLGKSGLRSGGEAATSQFAPPLARLPPTWQPCGEATGPAFLAGGLAFLAGGPVFLAGISCSSCARALRFCPFPTRRAPGTAQLPPRQDNPSTSGALLQGFSKLLWGFPFFFRKSVTWAHCQ